MYVDNVIIKSKRNSSHIADLKKFFDRLRKYNLKVNPAKCDFGVLAGKLLGFIISHRGIELDPSKVKAIQDLPPPKNKKDVMSFLGRLNYISRFIAQSTVISQKLRHYFCAYTTYLISRMDPLKYIFQKPMPTGKLAKWQILLSEFNIVYITQKAVKRQALTDHLAENPVDGEYEPLKIYFSDEEVSFVGKDITKAYDGWRMLFDGATNFKGVGIRAVLVSETGQHYPELLVIGDSDLLVHQVLGECATKNTKILPYLHYVHQLIKRFTKIEFKHVLRIQNEFADALSTLSSMIQHPDKNFIDPIPIGIQKQLAYCAHVEEEIDGNPWFHDIKKYLEKREYPETATHTQKRMLRRFANHFFQSGGIQYRRTPDLGLLRQEDTKTRVFLDEYGDRLHQGIDVIGPIEPAASNGNRFILVAIDYFTKWVEAVSYKVIKHRNSTAYRPQINEVIEAANKNIKKILRKMVGNYKKWHEKLPFALLGYRTTVRTSTGATPYLLVYGTEIVIPVEVEVTSLIIIQEAEPSDA
ncbi:uncharacterized protein [Nicotiana tomentosiformis]|uniref:uncharacterized protein n=1 Tax=Nicotiana tomentosiformis TaxID=4098 RepID=UPI00388C47BB